MQAAERAASRVQNYVADMAIASVKLAQLDVSPAGNGASEAQHAFEALRDEKVISKSLCRQLTRAQGARSRIEHSYVDVPAGDVHAAVKLVRESSADFVGPFAGWVKELLV